jgi:hypothetical protein
LPERNCSSVIPAKAGIHLDHPLVIPAKAGIHLDHPLVIPAEAGMTGEQLPPLSYLLWYNANRMVKRHHDTRPT